VRTTIDIPWSRNCVDDDVRTRNNTTERRSISLNEIAAQRRMELPQTRQNSEFGERLQECHRSNSIMLAASNASVWRPVPSFLLSIGRVAHTQRDSPGGSMRRSQHTFQPDNKEDRHACFRGSIAEVIVNRGVPRYCIG